METYNPMSLAVKAIMVIDASFGIGRTVADEYSKLGAQVICVACNRERLGEPFVLTKGKHTSLSWRN